MKKKLPDSELKSERLLMKDTDKDIIMFIDKRKEENSALNKILSNLKISEPEGKCKKDK